MHVNWAFFQLNRRQEVEVGVGNNKGGLLSVMLALTACMAIWKGSQTTETDVCVKRLSAKPTYVC